MVFAATLPAVNALTPSSVYERYSLKTDKTPGGQHICGDTLCSPSDWSKMQHKLDVAQRSPNQCNELKGWMYCGQPTMTSKTSS
jgi:hypothetical protein